MKAKFTTKDQKEINRLSKSLDMACFIFELTQNTDYDEPIPWSRVNDLRDQFGINIDDLIE